MDFKEHYKVGDIVYYLRVMENLGVNEIVEGTVRTIQLTIWLLHVNNNANVIY